MALAVKLSISGSSVCRDLALSFESRMRPKGINRKVETRECNAKVVLNEPDEALVLSLATTPTVGEVVERAVGERRIYPVAGNVDRIAQHLLQSTLRLS